MGGVISSGGYNFGQENNANMSNVNQSGVLLGSAIDPGLKSDVQEVR